MNPPSRLPSAVEGGPSQPRGELRGLIEPPTPSDESRQAVEHVNNVVLPAARRRMDMAERRYFGEAGKERSRRAMIYSHNWGVHAGHEHTAEVSKDAALLAANCGVPLMRSTYEPELDPVFSPDGIIFNGLRDACEDFIYPPTEGANPADGLLSNRGKCRTECRDYDTLVSAVLLAVKHHIGSKGSIRSTATPDSVGWQAAFELYARTFPERELPWLDNWPRRSSP